ncbi:alpha/beta fold hydrolase [Duganella callida]|uniref:Alpha/beta hydrolase n=1 Tax=Duganella callida TaxID=2561932 RepID=A0A4Y9SCZ1_9BURK|nr:alpha/beta hydrolase [Duganella callida]TFW20627.1 alpha/beta hydrolase [Duganella callida]
MNIRQCILAALWLAWSLGAHAAPPEVSYRSVKVDGVNLFYREAGPKDAPAILLLHGFPASSHMFRHLMPLLADRYRLIAPDYPGFGQSDMPPPDKFTYSFDNVASLIDKFTASVGLSRYALYVQDYGAPVGYRLASAHPERITAIVVQNGNAYDEGIAGEFWAQSKAWWADRSEANTGKMRPILDAGTTKWQYMEGARNPEHVSPDAWTLDQAYLDRPGNKEIQLELLYSYSSNPPRYAAWQAYFRKYQPPMLIVWGKNDKIFPPTGAYPYLRDLPKAELHLLDSGHFALEEDSPAIAAYMRPFLQRHLKPAGG